MIEITLLGTNALLPIPERALTAAVLACSGRTVLFDCGEGTQTAARKVGVSLMKTDLIALTHYHGDHIFGLPGLLQTMNCMGRTDPLYITGPDGLNDVMDSILRLVGETAYKIILTDMPSQGLKMKALNAYWPDFAKLSCFQTVHRVASCGYRFELERPRKFLADNADALGIPFKFRKALQNGETVSDGNSVWTSEMVLGEARRGLTFVFTGDTMYFDALADSCKGADLLICDATYAEDEQAAAAHERGHMTFAEAAQLAKKANARKLCLAHYSQMIEDPEQYLPNAAGIFPAAVCGYDGMKIILRFEN